MNRKYYTPMSVEIYRAPRGIFEYMGKSMMGTTPKGSELLSDINAMVDAKMDNNKIGESQAMMIFNLARKTLAETIQLN